MKHTPGPRPVPAWFREAKYGLFIHWGIYSVLRRGEQVLYREHLKPSEYRKLADTFRPRRFDPSAWARTARRAGMRYALFTSKHHDGFCMWDSRTSDFTSARTGLRRDYVGEYVAAFRKAGLKVGLYFSTADWSQPAYFEGPDRAPGEFDAFIRYTHEQVRELCSNFGRIDVVWFDGVWPYTAREWKAEELVTMIRGLQPTAIINDRIGLEGDMGTPEQTLPDQPFKPGRPWEECMTSTERWWGYHAGARWKSDVQAVRDLCHVAEMGGNLVYNVGPKPDGSLPSRFERMMGSVGEWMKANSEAIYGTSPTICDTSSFGLMTVKGNRVFLHVLHWPGKELILAGLKNKVRSARFLANGRRLKFRQDAEHVIVQGLPTRAPDPRNTVIVLDVDGKPESYLWARERLWTGSGEKTQDHSQQVAARMADWSKY